ncbi:MAG: GNAT family N-acetyltransferase [Candidatus Eremiobacteraeota bacterium]|nr:GNAT family N-acetyltransferase [Candidatus Eremiobacteraeota bacterium]MBV8644569.1 GNAT family N-acetyltransferase [Candidatus Eremiobacteraeota bacterium]
MTRPSWTVRPEGERDVDAAVKLLAEVTIEGTGVATQWPFDLGARARTARDALLQRRNVGWVALDGHRLVGELVVFEIDRDEPEFGMIVAATHRRRGIGAALLEHAIAWAQAAGKPALALRVFPENLGARALYERLGFVEVELQRGAVARRDGPPRDALIMRRPSAPG